MTACTSDMALSLHQTHGHLLTQAVLLSACLCCKHDARVPHACSSLMPAHTGLLEANREHHWSVKQRKTGMLSVVCIRTQAWSSSCSHSFRPMRGAGKCVRQDPCVVALRVLSYGTALRAAGEIVNSGQLPCTQTCCDHMCLGHGWVEPKIQMLRRPDQAQAFAE